MSSEKFSNLQHLTNKDMAFFWDRINKLIKNRGLTQEEVSTSISVNYQTFRSWSHYKKYPDLTHIYHIAQVLDTSINYLVFGTELEPSTNKSYFIGESLISLVILINKSL